MNKEGPKAKNLTEDEGLFDEIQKELVDIITELGYQKGRSKKKSIISAILYVKDEITQQELREFTKIYDTRDVPFEKKKGFSMGIISTILNKYVEQGYVKKDFRKDANSKKPGHKYYYSANGTFTENLGKMTARANFFLGSIGRKLLEVDKQLENPESHQKKGRDKLVTFSDNMKLYLQAYKRLIEKYQQQPRANRGSEK
ncbi:MAG: hypothetical protein ACTSRE_13770 [Promethearchaeota archaeon]